MKLRKGWFSIAILFLAVALIAGCGSTGTNAGSEPGGNANQGDSAQADGGQGGNSGDNNITYAVKHAMETTEIKGIPQRIVILTNEGTEALLAMGVKPVGAVKSWTGDPWYDHIKDQMEGVQPVGTESEPNLEAIAALKPDLIIGNKMRQEKVYEQLKAIAPTAFSEDLRGNWKINFKLYAQAIHREEKGDEVLQAYQDRIDAFKKQAGDKLKMKVSMVRFMAGDVRIYQKNTFSGVILDELGFQRPASQDVDDFALRGVTKEMIPQMDGDILFYFTYETGDGEANKVEQDWINDPLFQKLDVYKKGNIHKVDDVIWNTAGGVLAANLMLDDLEKIVAKQSVSP